MSSRPSLEVLRRAKEVVRKNVPRHELAPYLAIELQSLIDEQEIWQKRIDKAESAVVDALQYSNACERSAWEWKRKLDAALAKLEEERDWFEIAKQSNCAVRNKALEEAAQLCDAYARKVAIQRSLEATLKARAAADLSDQLRNLMSEP